MRERYFPPSRLNLERVADNAFAAGDFQGATDALNRLIDTNPHPQILHHAILKNATAPLYEIGYGTDDDKVYDRANDVYGLIGEFLRQELLDFSHDYHREVGRITEYVFSALPLRLLITNTTSTVMLPAPRQDDVQGIDFYQSPVGTQSITDGQSFQVKTRATTKDQEQYAASPTLLISMDDIDPYASDPAHPLSLAQTILRELRLSLESDEALKNNSIYYSPDADRERLDRATEWVQRKIDLKQRTVRLDRVQQQLAQSSIRATENNAA